jgi:iron complex outermembrane receptor protein
VSKQFLDNTKNEYRSLHSFFTQDLRASYVFKMKCIKELTIIAQVNNLFNKKYEPNGYTYSYIYGGQENTENYYFPMARTNLLVALNLRL